MQTLLLAPTGISCWSPGVGLRSAASNANVHSLTASPDIGDAAGVAVASQTWPGAKSALTVTAAIAAAATSAHRRKWYRGHRHGYAAAASAAAAAAATATTINEEADSNGEAVETGDSAAHVLSGSVYLWQTPLKLPAPFPAWLAKLLPRHSVVLADCADGSVAAFDFEPEDPESPQTAIQVLLGGSTPGRFGFKKLKRTPKGVVRLGPVRKGARVEDVTIGLRNSFNPRLALSENDCNSYSREVLARLLAELDGSKSGERLFSTLDFDALAKDGKAIYKEPSLLGAVALVAGTTVGAGILALPAVTQPVGFVPSTLGLFLAWVYMATTGLLIAEVALGEMSASGRVATSIQSMAARTIGPVGAAVSSLAFVIVHFGLLVAYMSRGGELLVGVLPGALAAGLPAPALFTAVFGGFVFLTKGSDALEAFNNAFTLAVLLSFVALVTLALPSADPARLLQTAEWARTTEIAPTLLLSLVYHNVVPTVCAQLEGDRQKITFAITVGSFLPLFMFLVWNGVILAAVAPGSADPLNSLLASQSGPLAAGVTAFSLSAIVTSFNGFVLALTDFFADALRDKNSGTAAASQVDESLFSQKRLRDFALTLVPALIVACYDPSLFFKAIDAAGAFGVSMLFGFLPAWMAVAQRSRESPVLVQQPSFLGGYARGPLVPGGLGVLAVVGGVALAVVAQNALEFLLH